MWDLATSNWTGPTTWVNGNAGVFSGAGESISVEGAISVAGMTFNNNGYVLTNGAGSLDLSLVGNNTFSVAAGVAAEIQEAVLGGAGEILLKTGAGTLMLSGGVAHGVETLTMSGGVLDVSGASTTLALSGTPIVNGTGGSILGSNGGKLLLGNPTNNVVATSGSLTIGAIIADGAGNKVTFGGIDTGTITLTGSNTWTKGTSIAASSAKTTTVSVSNIGSWGTGLASNLGTQATAIDGTISLSLGNASSKIVLRYTGTGETTNRPIALGGSSATIALEQAGTGLLKFAGDIFSSGGAPKLTLQGSGDGEIAGNISKAAGNVALIKDGTGTWTLSGANNFGSGSGNTATLSQGVLALASSGALGVGSTIPAIIFAGGTLQFTAANTTDYSAKFSTGVNQFRIDTGGQIVSFASSVIPTANASTFTKLGSGTLTLGGGSSRYTGATTISGGILSVGTLANGGVDSSIGTSSADASNLVFDGGGLKYTGGSIVSDRAFTINGGKTATIEVSNGVSNLTLVGATSATNGALTKTGPGTLTLMGANAYSGLTNVSAGTLALSGTGHIAGDIVVAAGATFDVAAQAGYSIGNGRTLLANGNVLVGAGKTLTVAGTLSGTGHVTGSVLASGATASVAPGMSPGVLHVTENFTLDAGAHLDIELGKNVAGAGNQPQFGIDYDGVQLSGVGSTLTLAGGDLRLSLIAGGAGIETGDVFYLILNGSAVSTVGTFATFSGVGVVNNGNGSITIGSQSFEVSTTADFESSNFASLTGNDVALLAIPEPSAGISLWSGVSCLIALSRFRRRN